MSSDEQTPGVVASSAITQAAPASIESTPTTTQQTSGIDIPDVVTTLLNPLDEFISLKLTEKLLLLASLCYVSGYIITNLHWASHGILSFHLLRERYIASGGLFLGFVLLISFLVRGLRRVIMEAYSKGEGIVGVALYYSLSRVSLVIVASYYLDGITGRTTPLPITILLPPYINPASWLPALITSVICIFSIALLSLVLLLIKKLLKKGKHKADWKEDLSSTVGIGMPMFWFLLILAPLTLPSFASQDSFYFGWAGIAITACSLYLTVAVWEVRAYIITPMELAVSKREQESRAARIAKTGKADDDYDELQRQEHRMSRAALIPIGLIILFLVYAYPYAPQQLGGGSAIPVAKLTLTKDSTNAALTNPDVALYIVDHTDNDVVLEIVDRQQGSTQIVQIPRSEITELVYQSPKH
jgi:hypothetical protein